MTNTKSTKRALLTSILAMVLCCSMLLGTTYAWFTDSVTSANNVIVAGNLDVELYHSDKAATDEKVDSTTALFNDIALWEPGAVVYENLTVANKGNLALKYQLVLNFSNATSTAAGKTLADVLKVAVIPGGFDGDREAAKSLSYNYSLSTFVLEGELEAEADPDVYGIVIYWQPSDNDNDYNMNNGQGDALSITIGVVLSATQLTYEIDSYDDQYDKDANFERVVDSGSYGAVAWSLTDTGKLSIVPGTDPVYDESAKKTYEAGAWREAVRYENGNAKAIVDPLSDKEAAKQVTSLIIGEGVTSIGSFGAKFPNLTGEVVIPASVTYIGQEAFQNTSITKLTFAAGGTEPLCIAPGAFKGLDIEEIVFPADRPEIHIHCWAFNDCTSLKRVTLPANITTFSGWTHVDYCGMNYSNGSDSQIFARCWALESITFGNQAVRDRFFHAAGNGSNIDAIGGVEIIINN